MKMCSPLGNQLEILTKVLDLVLVTDRLLEPWICDTICDNIRSVLAASDAAKESPDKKFSSSLHAVVHNDFHNVKLKLQVVKLVLQYNYYEFGSKLLSDIIAYLDMHPTEVLEICSLVVPSLQKGSYWMERTPCESIVPPRPELVGFSGMVTSLEAEDAPISDVSAHSFDRVMKKVRESSKSLCVPLRKAAISFMAKHCCVYFEQNPDEVLKTLLEGFDDQFSCDVVGNIFDVEKNGRNVAVILVNKGLNHLISPEHEGYKRLSKVRAHIVFRMISHGRRIADDIDVTKSPSDFQKAIEELNLNYHHAEVHDQSFYRELYELLLSAGQNKVIEAISAKICDAKNIVVISVISSVFLSNDSCMEHAKVSWQKIFRNQFLLNKIMQNTMDIIYDDCASMREQRCALSILNDIIDKDELIGIISDSSMCHHYSKCDETNFKCFMSTYLTFLMESSSASFAMLSDLTPKLFNIPEFTNTCHSLQLMLTKLLLRKLLSGDSRIRDIALDVVGRLNQSLVDHSVLKHILTASYTDEDFYIKSSCFKVLSGFHHSKLPGDLGSASAVNTINQIIIHIEHEDSMVTISFFKFLQEHYHLVKDHIQKNLTVMAKENRSIENGSKHQNGSDQMKSVDVDAVIDEVCDSADCADVSLIAAYREKETEASSLPLADQLVSGIFRLLSSDRCDVERMKASLELMITILKSLSRVEKFTVINFLQGGYFDLIESLNSPFLKETIADFNAVIEGARVFSELKTSPNQNLVTVLSLLESTPDPDIVMDCY